MSVRGLFQLDAGGRDHLRPLLQLAGNELAELDRGVANRLGPLFEEQLFNLGQAQDGGHMTLQQRYDGGRRVGRRQ